MSLAEINKKPESLPAAVRAAGGVDAYAARLRMTPAELVDCGVRWEADPGLRHEFGEDFDAWAFATRGARDGSARLTGRSSARLADAMKPAPARERKWADPRRGTITLSGSVHF